jgi:DNA processing protein
MSPAPTNTTPSSAAGDGACAAATVVVEARERSGALITADFALEEGREVFAVPGEITSALSAGTNDLLRLGATPLTCAADVLDALGVEAKPREVATHPLLELMPATADELVRATGRSPGEVAATLAELELSGLAAEGDGIYRAVTTSNVARADRLPAPR